MFSETLITGMAVAVGLGSSVAVGVGGCVLVGGGGVGELTNVTSVGVTSSTKPSSTGRAGSFGLQAAMLATSSKPKMDKTRFVLLFISPLLSSNFTVFSSLRPGQTRSYKPGPGLILPYYELSTSNSMAGKHTLNNAGSHVV